MIFCYIDESGTPEMPGTTSHYVLAGISIPIKYWKNCELQIDGLKAKYGLSDQEIHTGWLMRPYVEQKQIANFDDLDHHLRAHEAQKVRKQTLLKLQKNPTQKKLYRQFKKNYRQTEGYMHLTLAERKNFVNELAKLISSWGFARLFAECIDKIHFDPNWTHLSVDEQSFEQVVSRFEHYLKIQEKVLKDSTYGLLIHDNNETVALKHTQLMKSFHKRGTLWTSVNNIIETPLFVNSSLTSMIQIADLCAYALRRYVENGEEELFLSVFKRADRKDGMVVGVRHFTNNSCNCIICVSRKAHQ